MSDFRQILAADAQVTAANGEFSELITRYPLGNVDDAENIRATVDRDHEPGTNELPGDGYHLDGRNGESERTSWTIEIDAAIAVDDRDTWLIPDISTDDAAVLAATGKFRGTIRCEGRDSALQSIRVARTNGRITKVPRTRANGG